MIHPLLKALRRELRVAADPAKAPFMQAYMKSSMPYLGVSATPLRAVCRQVFAGYLLPSAPHWRKTALAVWRGARYREEKYGAIELTGDKRADAFQTLDSLEMYEEMIVTGAWWDYVDRIATRRLGPLLRRETTMARTMLAWSRSSNLWKRRSAILCQITFKGETDLNLLDRCIEPSLLSKEFFLQKAIGWALRQYAWTHPATVLRYVEANGHRLSALSRREALRNVVGKSILKRGRRGIPRNP